MKLSAQFVFGFLLTGLATAGNLGQVGFSRIVHGWTNYSTGFAATIDTDPDAGDFATLASVYTPLERTGNPAPLAIWSLISSAPAVGGNWKKLKLSNCDAAAQFYRLRSEAP